MSRVRLERLITLAQRYLDALGPLDAPLARSEGVSIAELEIDIHALAARLDTLPEQWEPQTANLVRHANALLARARGRLQQKLPQHPDILVGTRARLRAWKAAWRQAAPTSVDVAPCLASNLIDVKAIDLSR
jgi:hypothetical protein